MTLIYQIEFYNYWHSGSGLSGSTYADSIVNRDKDGLPIIPGKTLKGLLRNAAQNIHNLNPTLITIDFIENIFGKDGAFKSTILNDEGISFFSNAQLSKNLSQNILKEKLVNDLYTTIASTAIDDNGQAKEGSLRQMEVTIPLTMYAVIENFPEEYKQQLEYCFGWIKEMGQNRNRGLGKCKFSIYKN